MNKKLTADLPVGRQGTAKFIAENRKEMRILLALRPSSTSSLHRFASSQRTLRLKLFGIQF
jgi:hypothetical protein